jgi:hypothetical protein
VASQLIEEVTAHVQRDSLEDAREICADGTYFLNNLRMYVCVFVQVVTVEYALDLSSGLCCRKQTILCL